MSHGGPTGYVRLYDESGNPVLVRLNEDGAYALAVNDRNAEKLLKAMTDQKRLLEQILLQLASITGRGIDA